MYHNDIEIKEGAFIVGDAHYSSTRPELFKFIEAIHSKELHPTQLIFLGDIFDALFGSVTYTIQKNEKIISLLNEISQDIELIYLEGNHDFNIEKIFPFAKVFKILQQPVLCEYQGEDVLLAHGDFESNLGYRTYTAIIRNSIVLRILNFINNIFSNFILKNLDEYLAKKDDCKEFTGFRQYISKRLENRFKCDYFIEGHFHQNKRLNFSNFIYINLGAFACNQRYFIVKSTKDVGLVEEKLFY